MTARKFEYIYGYHTVAHAVDSSPELILELCYVKHKKQNRRLQAVLDKCRALSISTQEMTAKKMDALTDEANHQGVLARYTAPHVNTSISQLCDESISKTALILALDGIQDPHNLGACIRTANAAGVAAVLIPKNKSAPLNATVRKVACGAVESTNIVTVTNLSRSLKQLQQAGYWVVGADESADTSVFDFTPPRPSPLSWVMVMGTEGAGMRHNIRKQCDYLVSIPMHGEVSSVNVSVATGICLYQIRRHSQSHSHSQS